MSQVKPTGPRDMHEAEVRGTPSQSLQWIRLRAERKAACRDKPIRGGTLSADDVPKTAPQGTLPSINVPRRNNRNKECSQCSRYEGT